MDGDSAAVQNIIFFGLLIAGLYFLAIRPQRKRAQALAKVRSELAVGTRVMTTAGIHATVSELDGDTVLLELAPGVRVRFATQSVVRILDEPTESDESGDEATSDPAP
jgi:preprotein translocase subunit YajC